VEGLPHDSWHLDPAATAHATRKTYAELRRERNACPRRRVQAHAFPFDRSVHLCFALPSGRFRATESPARALAASVAVGRHVAHLHDYDQVSHVQEQTQPGADADCWTARQISTSLDYSMGEPATRLEMSVVTALAAGLNAQSLHHAMPNVSCAHFPRIYDEYARICERHGVRLRRSRNFATAVVEMLEYVFQNNSPEKRSMLIERAELEKSRNALKAQILS